MEINDSEVDDKFKEIAVYELENQLILAELEVKSKQLEWDNIKSERAEFTEQVSKTRNEYAETIHAVRLAAQLEIERLEIEREAKIKDAQAAAEALKTPEWDARMATRKAEEEAASLQRQLDQAKRAMLKAAEWATLENRWDLLTMGAPWREWAKDHQISGAKKVTYEGRLILGDTMGLGKTLTSIIAMDMIEAATKDASLDNPVEFGRES